MLSAFFSGAALFSIYVAAFSGAALACLAGTWRARQIPEPDTRWALSAFLLCSAGWAGSHVAYLLFSGTEMQYGFYVAGLVVGFWAVWAWLWFCFAYAGRSLHRSRGEEAGEAAVLEVKDTGVEDRSENLAPAAMEAEAAVLLRTCRVMVQAVIPVVDPATEVTRTSTS